MHDTAYMTLHDNTVRIRYGPDINTASDESNDRKSRTGTGSDNNVNCIASTSRTKAMVLQITRNGREIYVPRPC